MSKERKYLPLRAYATNGEVKYVNGDLDSPRFEVIKESDDKVTLKSIIKSGQTFVYDLYKHPSQNYYKGECNGHKVHVSLKALVGKLIYW